VRTPEDIKHNHQNLSLWWREAQEIIDDLNPEDKYYLRTLIDSLRRKTSKRLASSLINDICEFIDIDSPEPYIWENKFEGFFGINFVLSKTIYKLEV